MGQPLTPRQTDILAVLAAFISIHGYPPTVREASEAMGLSRNGLHWQLGELRRKGAIAFEDGRARSIRVLAGGNGNG